MSWVLVVVLAAQLFVPSLLHPVTRRPPVPSPTLTPVPLCGPHYPPDPSTSPRESPSSDSEDDSWTLEEGRERP